jgi:hypothetical protein
LSIKIGVKKLSFKTSSSIVRVKANQAKFQDNSNELIRGELFCRVMCCAITIPMAAVVYIVQYDGSIKNGIYRDSGDKIETLVKCERGPMCRQRGRLQYLSD